MQTWHDILHTWKLQKKVRETPICPFHNAARTGLRASLLLLLLWLLRSVDATVVYQCDSLNRLTLVRYDASNMIYYAYDPAGNRTKMVVIGPDNPDLDSDSDTLPDRWELTHFNDLSDSPTNDCDHDGLNNAEEYSRGTDPNDPDSDHDGMFDRAETLADTDPTNADSRLLISDLVAIGEIVKIEWQGGVWASQFVERAGAVLPSGTVWISIFTNSPPTETRVSFFDSGVTNASQYYRIRAKR